MLSVTLTRMEDGMEMPKTLPVLQEFPDLRWGRQRSSHPAEAAESFLLSDENVLQLDGR